MSIKANPFVVDDSSPKYFTRSTTSSFTDSQEDLDINDDGPNEEDVETIRTSLHDYLSDIRTKPFPSSQSSKFNIGDPSLERMTITEKVKLYESTKDKNIIYRLIITDLSNHSQLPLESMGEIPQNIIESTVETDVSSFHTSLLKYFKYSKLNDKEISLSTSLKNEILEIYRDFITGLYEFSDTNISKITYINIVNKTVLIDILGKCRDKGIIVDPSIYKLQNVEFNTDKSWEIQICLVYLPSINSIIYRQYDINPDYSGVNLFIKNTANLPNVFETVKEEEMIKINDKLYSKKSFESLVETNFDNFVQNLEIDCLLDKKDTDAVVDKLNLL